MNILIVNGSPKGKYSITLQTCKFLELKFPQHSFDVIHAGQYIKRLERDFTQAKKQLENAELVIFSYPVYTFIAPCQLHRFIELMKESKIDFSNKFATQISTSKHFYDVTAHNYIRDNCFDMSFKYIKGLSADMDDLTKEKGQQEAIKFFRYVLWNVENDLYEPLPKRVRPKKLTEATVPETCEKKRFGEVVVVTDCTADNRRLSSMIERFCAVFPRTTRVVNIAQYPIKGGCLGCFNCAVSANCVYKDGFEDLLRNEIQSAQAIVYAFTIKDHSMGSRFKMYDDRQFCNGHRTVTMGMPVAYLIDGEYSKESNLQMIIEGRSEVGGNFLCPIGSNEGDTDSSVDRMAASLDYALVNKHTQPANFLGVGGMKIFRDLIFLMQGLMRADHKFYKEHKQYDFPQKQMGRVAAMYLVGSMMASPKIKSKAGNMMNEGMLMPYKKVFSKIKKENK